MGHHPMGHPTLWVSKICVYPPVRCQGRREEPREGARSGSVSGWPDPSAVEKRKRRPERERNKEEAKPWHSIEYCAKEHISRFELATKTDRRPEFRVPPIQHLRSLYSCPPASLTYTTPHNYYLMLSYLMSIYCNAI